MWIKQRIGSKGRGNNDEPGKKECLDRIIASFQNPSYVDGYDQWVNLYLEMNGGVFGRESALKVVQSREFCTAFMDLERYDITLTRERSDVARCCYNSSGGFEDEQYDVLYHDNYVYLRDLVDSLIVYRGQSFYCMTQREDLLCAEYSTMRTVGFALHFIVNYAYKYEEAMQALDEHAGNFISLKALKFFNYLKGRLSL